MRRSEKDHMVKKLFFLMNKVLTFRYVQTAKQAGYYTAFDDDVDASTSERDMNDAIVVLDV